MHRLTLSSSLLLALTGAPAANIVSNPGFESGLADWTGIGLAPGWIASSSFHTGSGSARTGCIGSDCITTPQAGLYQDLATTNGTTYAFSLWFMNQDAPGNHLQVLAGGNVLTDLINQPGDSVWRQITLSFTATGITTRIQFNGRSDLSFVRVDDVCVDVSGGACGLAPNAIPEPGTGLTACASLLVLASFARKRYRGALWKR